MIGDHKHVDGANGIIRAHQLEFLVPGEIAQMHDPKLPERYHTADGIRVLDAAVVILVPGLESRAFRVGMASAWQLILDHISCRSHDAPVEACNRNPVAGFHYRVLCFGVERRIYVLEKLFAVDVGLLCVRAVVDEIPYLDARRELGRAAKMIAVPVCRDEVVDMCETGVLYGVQDAVDIPGIRSAASGIDQR